MYKVERAEWEDKEGRLIGTAQWRYLFLSEMVLLKGLQECLDTAQSESDCCECRKKNSIASTYEEIEKLGVSVKALIAAFEGDL
jgi:hypothetical protein